MEKLPHDVPGFVVNNVLDPQTCSKLIAHAESVGFLDKSVVMFAGDRLRATFTDEKLAQHLWSQIAPHTKPHLHDRDGGHSFLGPDVSPGWYEPVGINPFMRVSKYLPGKSFRTHTDTAYSQGDQYVGMHTLLLYLNGDMTGGETIVFGQDGSCTVKPAAGKILGFYHYTPHEGAIVKSGIKYIIRTELMFKRR